MTHEEVARQLDTSIGELQYWYIRATSFRTGELVQVYCPVGFDYFAGVGLEADAWTNLRPLIMGRFVRVRAWDVFCIPELNPDLGTRPRQESDKRLSCLYYDSPYRVPWCFLRRLGPYPIYYLRDLPPDIRQNNLSTESAS